jgi:hypothetical protein
LPTATLQQQQFAPSDIPSEEVLAVQTISSPFSTPTSNPMAAIPPSTESSAAIGGQSSYSIADSNHSPSVPLIAGGAVLGLAVMVVFSVVGVRYMKRRSNDSKKSGAASGEAGSAMYGALAPRSAENDEGSNESRPILPSHSDGGVMYGNLNNGHRASTRSSTIGVNSSISMILGGNYQQIGQSGVFAAYSHQNQPQHYSYTSVPQHGYQQPVFYQTYTATDGYQQPAEEHSYDYSHDPAPVTAPAPKVNKGAVSSAMNKDTLRVNVVKQNFKKNVEANVRSSVISTTSVNVITREDQQEYHENKEAEKDMPEEPQLAQQAQLSFYSFAAAFNPFASASNTTTVTSSSPYNSNITAPPASVPASNANNVASGASLSAQPKEKVLNTPVIISDRLAATATTGASTSSPSTSLSRSITPIPSLIPADTDASQQQQEQPTSNFINAAGAMVSSATNALTSLWPFNASSSTPPNDFQDDYPPTSISVSETSTQQCSSFPQESSSASLNRSPDFQSSIERGIDNNPAVDLATGRTSEFSSLSSFGKLLQSTTGSASQESLLPQHTQDIKSPTATARSRSNSNNSNNNSLERGTLLSPSFSDLSAPVSETTPVSPSLFEMSRDPVSVVLQMSSLSGFASAAERERQEQSALFDDLDAIETPLSAVPPQLKKPTRHASLYTLCSESGNGNTAESEKLLTPISATMGGAPFGTHGLAMDGSQESWVGSSWGELKEDEVVVLGYESREGSRAHSLFEDSL